MPAAACVRWPPGPGPASTFPASSSSQLPKYINLEAYRPGSFAFLTSPKQYVRLEWQDGNGEQAGSLMLHRQCSEIHTSMDIWGVADSLSTQTLKVRAAAL